MATTSPGSSRVRAIRSKPYCEPLTIRMSSGRASTAERRVAGAGVVLEQLLAFLADHRVQHPTERVRRKHRAVRHAAGERDQSRGQAPGEGSEPPPLPFAEADPRAPRE